MGNSDKEKTQRRSLWTTTLADMDPADIPTQAELPTQQEIEKAIQYIKDNKIDINKSVPEIERLKKIFEPQKL